MRVGFGEVLVGPHRPGLGRTPARPWRGLRRTAPARLGRARAGFGGTLLGSTAMSARARSDTCGLGDVLVGLHRHLSATFRSDTSWVWRNLVGLERRRLPQARTGYVR